MPGSELICSREDARAALPPKIRDPGTSLKKTIVIYAVVLAAIAFLLEWLEYRFLLHRAGSGIYIVVIATGFAALGIWVGRRLTGRPGPERFEKNTAALESLGITDREYTVLELLADGRTNKEIARKLGVSPNTVKTHISRLYEKLEVNRRTQAVQKARLLRLIC